MTTSREPGAEPEPLQWFPGWSDAVSGMMMVGHDGDGAEFLMMPYSHPRQWAVPSRVLTKAEVETWHLGQFAADYWCGTGVGLAPFGVLKSERPDFLFVDETGAATVGIEFTSFAPRKRRAIEAPMRNLRRALRESADRLMHLAGCHIWLSPSPGKERGQWIPLDPMIVVDALTALERPEQSGAHFVNGFPEAMPEGIFTHTAVGTALQVMCYEVLPRAEAQGNHVWRIPRVDPQWQIHVSREEVLSDFARLIDSHDYPECDVLVVAVGGPDVWGSGYFEDGMLLNAALESEADIASLIKRKDRQVYVHWWPGGKIEQLLPDRAELSRELGEHERRHVLVCATDNPDVVVALEPSKVFARVMTPGRRADDGSTN